MVIHLRQQLQESLAVVDTCLECIYSGKTHMYRPLAGQLRLLLCDRQNGADKSLLATACPELKISALDSINWSHDEALGIKMAPTVEGTNRIANMPIEIYVYENGLAIADLLLKENTIPIAKWSEQTLTYHPVKLDIKKVIRTVADKGGGAHVDSNASKELLLMYEQTPSGKTYAELFIVGIGRVIQRVGEQLFQTQCSRVPQELITAKYDKYNLLVASHQNDTAE